MGDNLFNIKVEDTSPSTGPCAFNAIFFDEPTVKVEVKNEFMAEEEFGINDTEIRMKGMEAKNSGVSLEDLSPPKSSSYCTSSGQFLDTNVLTKEEDLEMYVEEEEEDEDGGDDDDDDDDEEGFAEVDLDFGSSFGNKEYSLFSEKACQKLGVNEAADEFGEIESRSQEPVVSSIADSEPVSSKQDKTESPQGDPVVLSSKSKFACLKCTASFQSKKLLKQHECIHSPERPFTCTQCSCKFKRKDNLIGHLQTHLPVHSKKKPFICIHCPARFTRKYSMKKHLAVHSSEKLFICTHCPARFCWKDNLQAHIATHSSEKRFICTHCPAKFIRKDRLKEHLFTHSGEKPFTCTHCPAKFIRKDRLKAHLATHLSD